MVWATAAAEPSSATGTTVMMYSLMADPRSGAAPGAALHHASSVRPLVKTPERRSQYANCRRWGPARGTAVTPVRYLLSTVWVQGDSSTPAPVTATTRPTREETPS